MTAKAYFPALYVAGVSLVAWIITGAIADNPLLQSLAPIVDAVPLVGLAIASIMGAVSSYQLWRWESGHGLNCSSCGGMLGRERDGRHGAYRKCVGCGKNVNCKHY